MRAGWLIAFVVACGVRAPAPIDVAALVAKRGPVEARRDLAIRVIADPRDVQARLALATLAVEAGRPGEAIEQLDAVERVGGPAGTRWHDADRERFGQLLLARGRARVLRESPSALADFERAAKLGAAPRIDVDLWRARAAVALAQLRHVDHDERAKGRATLAELAGRWSFDPSWVGAKPNASAADRGRFGDWLWHNGARREAYEQLAAWHAATHELDDVLEADYLRALAWWSPSPSTTEPVDPRASVDNPDAEAAVLATPLGARSDDPRDAEAYAIITLRAALRGRGGWLRAFAARVDLARLKYDQVRRPIGPVLAQLAGKHVAGASDAELDKLDWRARFVAAAGRALAGESVERVRAAMGLTATDPLVEPDASALLAIVAPSAPFRGDDARAQAVARFARTRAIAMAIAGQPSDGLLAEAGVASEAALLAIARGFRRDPAIAERLGRELVATSIDAALAQATLGYTFAALGDPARSREAWQAAVDASNEPAFVAGYAEAAARTGDGDAALVAATGAAAASGDPAVVWLHVARTLLDVHHAVDALAAVRSVLDLGGPDVLPGALDVAIDASRMLGRDRQADTLAVQRARLAPPVDNDRGDDPTDAIRALAELGRSPSAAAVARAWIASRWNPRDIALRTALLDAIADDDPRRGTIIAELVALAGDADPERALAAALALRR